MKKKIHIIGSGISSLAASCYMAKSGYQVTVLEKNKQLGGRARQFKKDGFTFDIGPTWYWMPDIFERFFNDFNKKPSDFYVLNRLDPAYEVYFDTNKSIKIAGNLDEIKKTFEQKEKGAGKRLEKFIRTAQKNYSIAIENLVYKPGNSLTELISKETIMRLNLFIQTIRQRVYNTVKDKELRSILEFPVLFLGAKPSNTPAFYDFMNYADFGLGTWHPEGGMYKVIEAMVNLAKELGVEFITDCSVEKIIVQNKKVNTLKTSKGTIETHLVLSGADYHHTESLLDTAYRSYTESYWNKKTFAPSALLFFVGFDKKIKNCSHHTLFFDCDFDLHAKAIYDDPKWPDEPLFYVSFPSINDKTVAPEGKEAGIFLIPLAPDLKDTNENQEYYFNKIIARFEKLTNQSVKEHILFKEAFGINDFKQDYNSYKGNAYGLANTLFQTAYFRPKIKSKKVANLYFTGQLTVPGPGVPPSIISGKIASELIIKQQKQERI